MYVDGQALVIGGTSPVAPLRAGPTARLQQLLGQRLAPLQPHLCTAGTAGAAFHDTVEGDNGAYRAGPAWDACTGLGSPDRQALLGSLSA